MTANWKEIHLDFTEELVQEWKDKDFGYEEVEELVEVGFKPTEFEFADSTRLVGWNAKNIRENDNLPHNYEHPIKSIWHEKCFMMKKTNK